MNFTYRYDNDLVICFVAKWLTDTHELVMLEAEKAGDEEFDPYKLL